MADEERTFMDRRRIWIVIIAIVIAGVSITWATEKFVSSRGVDTAAVVGFQAEAQPAEGENPYLAKRMKAADRTGVPAQETDNNGGTSYEAAEQEKENAVFSGSSGSAAGAKEKMAADNSAGSEADADAPAVQSLLEAKNDVQGYNEEADAETVKSPLEPADVSGQNSLTDKNTEQEYTTKDIRERLETVRQEAEKYPDDTSQSQASRYAAAEYVWNLWDRELNFIYSSIRGQMDDETAENLRKEEVEWLKKRDLAAERASAKPSGTSGQNTEYVRTSAEKTKERCYELLESYGGFLDGAAK